MPEKFPPGRPASVNARYCAEDEAVIARAADTMSIPLGRELPQSDAAPIEILRR